MAETFNFDHSERYTLSIRLSTDGFSFSVFNPLPGYSFYYSPYRINRALSMVANIKEMIQQNEQLTRHFKRVRIYTAQNNFIPVPQAFFSEEAAEGFYLHGNPRDENALILHNLLPKAEIVMLYSMSKAVHQQLKEQYPEARFYSIASPLTEYLSEKSRLGNSRKLYGYLYGNLLIVLAFDKGKLLLLNTFTCKQTEDYLYYLLYVWKQLEYDANREELHLTGTIPTKEVLIHNLRKYLRQVYVMNPTAEFNRLEFSKLEEVPFDLQTSFAFDI